MSSDSGDEHDEDTACVAADAREWVTSLKASLHHVTDRSKMSLEEAARKLGLPVASQSMTSHVFHYIVAVREEYGKGAVVALFALYEQDCLCKGKLGGLFEVLSEWHGSRDVTDFIVTTVSINVKPAFMVKCIEALPKSLGTISVGNMYEHLTPKQWQAIGAPMTYIDTSAKRCSSGFDHSMYPHVITIA